MRHMQTHVYIYMICFVNRLPNSRVTKIKYPNLTNYDFCLNRACHTSEMTFASPCIFSDSVFTRLVFSCADGRSANFERFSEPLIPISRVVNTHLFNQLITKINICESYIS